MHPGKRANQSYCYEGYTKVKFSLIVHVHKLTVIGNSPIHTAIGGYEEKKLFLLGYPSQIIFIYLPAMLKK